MINWIDRQLIQNQMISHRILNEVYLSNSRIKVFVLMKIVALLQDPQVNL